MVGMAGNVFEVRIFERLCIGGGEITVQKTGGSLFESRLACRVTKPRNPGTPKVKLFLKGVNARVRREEDRFRINLTLQERVR